MKDHYHSGWVQVRFVTQRYNRILDLQKLIHKKQRAERPGSISNFDELVASGTNYDSYGLIHIILPYAVEFIHRRNNCWSLLFNNTKIPIIYWTLAIHIGYIFQYPDVILDVDKAQLASAKEIEKLTTIFFEKRNYRNDRSRKREESLCTTCTTTNYKSIESPFIPFLLNFV